MTNDKNPKTISLSLSLSHTHTHARARAHKHTCMHTHACKCMHTYTCIPTFAFQQISQRQNPQLFRANWSTGIWWWYSRNYFIAPSITSENTIKAGLVFHSPWSTTAQTNKIGWIARTVPQCFGYYFQTPLLHWYIAQKILHITLFPHNYNTKTITADNPKRPHSHTYLRGDFSSSITMHNPMKQYFPFVHKGRM